ncbi:MAG: HAD-IA family hydrolase [Gammaproteobacteria bacterium]|nr:HAD-IA family hydrolase [Gammaproteobacteria bacterium]
MKNRFDLIVFDWDGTLMDSEARIVSCMQRAAADCDMTVPEPETARDAIGLGLNEAIARVFPGIDAKSVGRLADAYRTHWLGDEVAQAVMFEGAVEMVHSLHAEGHLLAVATGKSRRGLDKALLESGLEAFFHMTRCADEAFSKPHPQMLLDILTDLDTPPERALMIGDTEFDVQMAVSARVAVVGVAHGVHSADRLLAAGAKHCFDDLPSLNSWLRSHIATPSMV